MAASGRKVFYTIGGKGLKPETNFKNVAPGRFTKASRSHKCILQRQTRVHADLTDTRLVDI